MNIAQTNMSDAGQLQVRVTSSIGFLPVENASIEISYTGDPSSVIEKLSTDKNGVSETIDLDAPPLEYSMEPSENQPYSEYTITFTNDLILSMPAACSILIGIMIFSIRIIMVMFSLSIITCNIPACCHIFIRRKCLPRHHRSYILSHLNNPFL